MSDSWRHPEAGKTEACDRSFQPESIKIIQKTKHSYYLIEKQSIGSKTFLCLKAISHLLSQVCIGKLMIYYLKFPAWNNLNYSLTVSEGIGTDTSNNIRFCFRKIVQKKLKNNTIFGSYFEWKIKIYILHRIYTQESNWVLLLQSLY